MILVVDGVDSVAWHIPFRALTVAGLEWPSEEILIV